MPLTWWEGIKGRGNINDCTIFTFTLTPTLSLQGRGDVFDFFLRDHQNLKFGFLDCWLLIPDLYNSFIRCILELMDLMVVFETIRLPN